MIGDPESIVGSLYFLIKFGGLDLEGVVTNWTYSEVRLAATKQKNYKQKTLKAKIDDSLWFCRRYLKRYNKINVQKITFFILPFDDSIMAENQNKQVYEDDYLIGFIYQSMVDSIPEPWVSARMDGYVGITKSGKQEIAGIYFYMPSGDKGEVQFSVTNTFGPLNAISYLRENSTARGEEWKNLKLRIFPDQTHKLSTW
ncbi:hypothetical protein [Microbulbifer sp. THAF38]|uniref:hypothetical protein n=1 Tax=Microbulbifer sp. THAF38 TaxID=2587856 RepID=UPI001268A2C3|nr:hypothetical protein [Microbulbifer sp. THAF38]QFT54362.1 hypothetical protein FIU95_07295 [Microbulbifer sp. THAF38]